jgi:hypothetical protein
MSKETGYIVYEGKSVLNGEPIVGIIVNKSVNAKTGNMYQLHILRSDILPLEAIEKGTDDAICGGCVHRRSNGGACYVNVGQGPTAVYKKYTRGGYRTVTIKDFKSLFGGKKVRFGAYGDPLALPLHILVSLKAVVKNNTSYTHQWKNSIIDGSSEMVAKFSMASVDNLIEKEEANKAGFRTFRVITEGELLQKDEIICPNETTGVNCIKCGLCSGNSVKAKNIAIHVHGSLKSRFNKEVGELTIP